jgi:hypothetical protein
MEKVVAICSSLFEEKNVLLVVGEMEITKKIYFNILLNYREYAYNCPGGSLRIVAAELGRALLKAVTSVGSVGGKGRAVLLLFLRNQFVKGGDLLNQLIRK